MNLTWKAAPRWLKQMATIAGLLLALPGLFIGPGFLCLTLALVIENESEAITVGLIGFTMMLLTVGTGGAIFWHGTSSLQGKVSKPLHLPSTRKLAGMFAVYVVVGAIIFQSDFLAGLFFPPTVLVAVSIPPLLAVSWFMNRQADGITWRQAVVVFTGSALLSVFVGIVVQSLLLMTVSLLAPNPGRAIINSLNLFEDLVSRDVSRTIWSEDFIHIFIQMVIIIPVVGALAKPLVTLPFVGYLSRRETFLMGVIAGAGFATLESVVYVGIGSRFWIWVLITQALGGAIHPLGAGLTALGWRDLLKGKSNAWPNWLARFGIATALHMLWNTGFLLFISLIRSGYFGRAIFNDYIVGELITVVIVPFLIGLGLISFWIGRAIGQQTEHTCISDGESETNRPILSDRAMAIYALAGVIALIPVGIVGLQIWLR